MFEIPRSGITEVSLNMATYKYEVIQEDGKPKKGTIDAANEEAAFAELRAAGHFIVSVKMVSAFEKDLEINIGRVAKPRELSVFCRQFESVLNAGVTVIDALQMLAEQTSNKSFRYAIEEVRDSVQRGETLADSMAMHPKVFPELMIHMVAAGEASGSLDVAFNRIGLQMEKSAHLAGVVAKSMVYPVILIVVIIAVVFILLTNVVPTFSEVLSEADAQLPAITVAVMAASDFMVHSWYWFVIGAVVLVLFLRAFSKTERGALLLGQLTLHLPLFGNLVIKTSCASLTRTLSTLLATGIPMIDSVGIVEKTIKNAMVRQAVRSAKKQVTEGVPLSDPLEESGVFPPMVYHMIRIGEETGNLEEMLDKIAAYYDEEVLAATEGLVAALEPAIIIVMAATVLPIIFAVLMPMFSLYEAIG